MAGNENRDRVRSDCLTYRPGLIRLSDLSRDLSIRRHMAVWDRQKLVVDLALKLRRHAGEVERQVERCPLFGKVRLQLFDGRAQLGWPDLFRIRVTLAGKWTEFDPTHTVG